MWASNLIYAAILLAIAGAFAVRSAARLQSYATPVALWQETADAQPRDAVILRGLAESLLEAGRAPEAVPHFESALKLSPRMPEVHYAYGCCLLVLGRAEEGCDQLNRAVELRPHYAGAWANLAVGLSQLGRRAEAVAAARRALELAHQQGNKTLARRVESWLTVH